VLLWASNVIADLERM